ncbi:hypothetical protein, partial [Pseudomonas sp. Bi130]|uniref:hypothetical protein n=1 Tax=Pseudomonas sp. Bi130 TaxID=2821122 RepID=UPI001E57A7CF
VKGGASSLTPMQLRDCAIDSQVLFFVSLAQCCRASLGSRYSFDIIRANRILQHLQTSLA